jgi:hypothetical protein
MRVAVRKLQIEDAAKLQMLVAENIDAIEPGLVVLDSRLLLGHTTIDVVGLDVNGALVLIATGLTANEEMLLKAVEAYSWCREYPQSLERLYPSCVISDERPPRLVFAVERVPDAFHRKIKQLGFPEVDCVEFRLLDVEGAPAVYFESILRLRRPAATPAAPPAAAPADAPIDSENVIAIHGPVAARATSVKLQKLLNQAVAESAPRASERPVTPSREPASVVSMLNRQTASSAPRVERPRPEPVPLREATPMIAPTPIVDAAPAIVPEPVFVPGPIIVTPEPIIATPEPVVVAPVPVIVTPEPIVLPKASVEEPPVATAPDADLVAQVERALAAIDHKTATPEPDASEEPVLAIEPKVELVAVEPALALEPKPELVIAIEPAPPVEPAPAVEPTLQLVVEPAPVEEPTLTLVSDAEPAPAIEPKLELAVEPEASVPLMTEPAVAPSVPVHSVPSLSGERISLRSLPELSLQPSAPVAMPRPAPIPAPSPFAVPRVAPATAAGQAAADAQPPRVSFKDLAAALLGSTPVQATPAAPATPSPVEAAVAPPTPTPETPAPKPVLSVEPALAELVALAAARTPAEAVAEPVSPAMAEIEPALTVEALIKSTLEAPAAPAAAAPAPQAPQPAAALPLQFEGLKFPNDGVLTRQWMEFLSQMSTTK